MTPDEKKILVFTSIAHFLTHFFILVFPVLVMPMSRELNLELSRILSISFLMYMCYGIFAIPYGYLSDRIGAGWIMGAGLIIAGLGFVLAGTADSIFKLSVFLSLVGIGCSAYHPSGLGLLSRGIKARGRAMGINGIWGNLGIAASPIAAGSLSYFFGWKNTLLILGIIGITLGALCLKASIDVPRDQDMQKNAGLQKQKAFTLFLVLCFAMLFSGLLYRGFSLILPAFLELRLEKIFIDIKALFAGYLNSGYLSSNADTLMATISASLIYIFGMIGQMIGGRIADKYELRKAYIMFFIIALPFLILLKFTTGILLILSAGFFVMFAIGMQPIENSLVAMLSPPRWRSMIYGIKFTVVFGAGSMSVHFASLVEKRYGLESVISLLICFLLMTLLFLGFLLLLSRGNTIIQEKNN